MNILIYIYLHNYQMNLVKIIFSNKEYKAMAVENMCANNTGCRTSVIHFSFTED